MNFQQGDIDVSETSSSYIKAAKPTEHKGKIGC